MRESKYPSGSRHNRTASSGYWKATGRDKQISVGKGGQVVGMKKVLVFYQGRPPRGCRTDWIMHEYRLAGAVITGDRNSVIVSMQIHFLFTLNEIKELNAYLKHWCIGLCRRAVETGCCAAFS